MFKCGNCRHVTDLPLTATEEGREVLACPHCGDFDLVSGDICEDCGHFFEEANLFGGLCLDCLRERIDYPTGLSYLLARDDLRTFLEDIDGDYARTGNAHALLMAYLTHEIEDQNWGRETFLEALREFIMVDCAAQDFAIWLAEEGAA